MKHEFRVLGVMSYGVCFACDGSINEGWEVGVRETNDFRGAVCNFEWGALGLLWVPMRSSLVLVMFRSR